MKGPPCFDDPETKRLIRELCERHRIDIDLLKALCEVIQEGSGFARHHGVDAEIANCIDQFLARQP